MVEYFNAFIRVLKRAVVMTPQHNTKCYNLNNALQLINRGLNACEVNSPSLSSLTLFIK